MPLLRHEEAKHRTTAHYLWIAKCRGCPNAVWITTQDDDVENAIRGWSRYANGEWRKH